MSNRAIEHMVFSDDGWPRVDVHLPVALDLEFSEQFAVQLETVLLRDQRFCICVDASNTRQVPFPVIKRLGAFASINGDRLDRQIAALALVVPSAFVRGAVRVLFTLKTPRHPHQIVRQSAAAEAYLHPYLMGLGVRTAASG